MGRQEREKLLLDVICSLFTENEVKAVVEEGIVWQRARPGVEFCRIEKYQNLFPRTNMAPALVVTYHIRPLPTTEYILYDTYLAEVERRRRIQLSLPFMSNQ